MKRVYVGNLSRDTTEEELRLLFRQHGKVDSVALMRRRGTGQPRGYGFVEMADADAAIAALHNIEFGGRTLTVHQARPQDDRP